MLASSANVCMRQLCDFEESRASKYVRIFYLLLFSLFLFYFSVGNEMMLKVHVIVKFASVSHKLSEICSNIVSGWIWISKISEIHSIEWYKEARRGSMDACTYIRGPTDAGQSVRAEIFKINSGGDCFFQNSYLNPFSRKCQTPRDLSNVGS